MKTYLITGAAGFIGANYLKYILKLHKDIKIVVLDVLTYAGNLDTIKDNIEDKRVIFQKGDIRDAELIKNIIAKYENKEGFEIERRTITKDNNSLKNAIKAKFNN